MAEVSQSSKQTFHSLLYCLIFSPIFTRPIDSWLAWLGQENTTSNKHVEEGEVMKCIYFLLSLFKVLIIGLIKPFDKKRWILWHCLKENSWKEMVSRCWFELFVEKMLSLLIYGFLFLPKCMRVKFHRVHISKVCFFSASREDITL